MEHGNKKRVIIISAIILAIILIGITAFAFCSKSEKDHFSSSKADFFEHVLRDMEQGDIDVNSVDVYYKDGYVYYDTFVNKLKFSTGEKRELELVYYGREGNIEGMLNPNWEDKLDAEDEYHDFLKAKAEGEHYKFSAEEIARYVEEYYQK